MALPLGQASLSTWSTLVSPVGVPVVVVGVGVGVGVEEVSLLVVEARPLPLSPVSP